MKRLRIATLVVLILSLALLFAAVWLDRRAEDATLPAIQCDTNELRLSAADPEEALLEGVTAWDGKDGDLTSSIVVERVSGTGTPGTATVTYAVADSDHHVASCSRTVVYTDYVSPRFSLTKPLSYTVGESILVRNRLQAFDVLDGSLTDRIKINAGSLNSYYEGSYPITVEVSNSLGDTAQLTLNIEIRRAAANTPVIELKEYLIYLDSAAQFDPSAYLSRVTGGELSAVTASPEAAALQPGVNQVVYSCTGSGGAVGTATLYVIVG